MRSEIERIAIIGAGVGGLITAKTFLEEGFDCEIFEKKDSLGGVWESGYHSLHLQLKKGSYELPDWPMPQSFPEYPSGDQVVSYLNSYVRHFKVFEKIRFGCQVEKMEQLSDRKGYRLHCRDTKEDQTTVYDYDLVVICSGLYSSPRIPKFPNQDQFKGRIVHTSEFHISEEYGSNGQVVVVGFGKSALDRVEDAAQITDRVTLLFRRAHWPMPRKFFGLLDNKFIINRFVSAFLPLYRHPARWEQRLHRYGGWFVWLFWRLMELTIRVQFRLKSSGALPTSPLERDIFTGDFVASDKVYPKMRNGVIRTKQASIEKFTERGIQLSNGEHLEADTVVLGTGWQYDYSILPDEFQSVVEDDGLYLFRHILHPDFRRLVFVGMASTFQNSLSDFLQARWLVAALKDDITLDRSQMLQEIERMKVWKRDIMPEQSSRGSLLQLHILHYHDELLRDLDINCYRKSNPFAEVFDAYLPVDYRDLPSEYLRKRAVKSRGKAVRQPYTGIPEKSLAATPISNLEGSEEGSQSFTDLDLRGRDLDRVDFSGRNLSSADLRHTNLHGCNLTGTNLSSTNISGADLTSAEMFNANLERSILSRVNLEQSFLIEANLSEAYLHGANLTQAHLSGANLKGARLNNSRLTGADLSHTCLVDADLRGANLENCDLSNADLSRADLTGTNLTGATLLSANFSGANITGVQFGEREKCRDIQIETAHGNALFKRFAMDQAYVEEYKVNNPVRYFLWKYSSNCGRSLSLWIFWCAVIAVGFSLVFHFHLGGSESFVLSELAKEPGYSPEDWAPMLYYSVVTFTTLGFGDIVPRTQEAAWWIMVEVIAGYLMLGGLITILATKLARRS